MARKAERLPQVPYQENRCHVCWGNARRFSSVEVPELLEYLAHRITLEQLEPIARSRVKGGGSGCLHAPLSGVSICSQQTLAGVR